MNGKYIVIEGTDGSGKSTVSAKLIEKLKAEEGVKVWSIHEPGSTPIGEAIRTIVKDASLERTAMTELLLFTAARAELADEIRHQLEAGVWVISSRNYLSSIVYQGAGRGLGMDYVQKVCDDLLPDFYVHPDLTIVIDVDTQTASDRRHQRDAEASKRDAFESCDETFQQKLVDGYRTIASKQSLPILDGRHSIDQLTDEAYELIRSRLL